jgi:hypothetical protein
MLMVIGRSEEWQSSLRSFDGCPLRHLTLDPSIDYQRMP